VSPARPRAIQEAEIPRARSGALPAGTIFLDGKYLAAPWNGEVSTSCACCSAPVGWRYRDGNSSPWSALGASGSQEVRAGGFRLPESGFLQQGSAPSAVTARLDPAVVQAWVQGDNQGLRVVTGVDQVHVSYVQPQRDSSARPTSTRPQLSVTYVE
jgi:hypothetical protein